MYKEEKQLIIYYGNKLLKSGLTVGTGGNLSIFIEKDNLMLITPTGIPYGELKEEDIVGIDISTKNVVIGCKKPSSEYMMHLKVYQNRSDIKAFIHTHSKYATILSCLRKKLPAIDYLVAHGGGNDIKCCEYATYGSEDLADNSLKSMKNRKAVLLANHGINVGEKNLENTYNILEQLEFCAELYIKALGAGEPVILDDVEMEKMVEKFKNYGQQI